MMYAFLVLVTLVLFSAAAYYVMRKLYIAGAYVADAPSNFTSGFMQ